MGHVDGLGTYRAVTVDREDGTSVVTALPWDDSTGTLQGDGLVEVVIGAPTHPGRHRATPRVARRSTTQAR